MIHKKLVNARILLQNAKLEKSGLNKFAGFKYFELADFLPTINNICHEVGMCGTISFTPELATLTLTDIDDSTSVQFTCPTIEVSLKGCIPVQGLGAMQTYIRRYLWVNAFEITEHDAIDATSGKEKSGVHKPTDNEAFKPDADEETFLLSVVDSIIAAKSDIDTATNLFYGQNLDNDQKVYIWDKLGNESALRRAMKKHHQSNEGK